MFKNFHDQQVSQWCESFCKSTEPESHQTAKINFISSDELAQNCVNLSRGFHPKQQLFSIYTEWFTIPLLFHNFEVSQDVCNYPPL